MTTARAIIYTRISFDKEGKEVGVKRQEADARRWCKANGVKVVEVVADNDQSAAAYGKRKKWRYVLEQIDAGAADTIVVYHLDRLTRHPRDLEDVIDRAKAGARVVFLALGLDLGTDLGQTFARILVAIAAMESMNTARRVKRAVLEAVEQGRPWGPRRAFGYAAGNMTIEPAEARALRTVCKKMLAGETLSSCVAWLNAEDIKPTAGGKWGRPSLRHVLLNPRNAGLRAHNGEVVGQAAWPAIIDEGTFRRIEAILLSHSARSVTPKRSAFTAILRCGLCEQPLTRASSKGYPQWRCRHDDRTGACGKLSISANGVDQVLEDAIFLAVDTLDLPAVDDAPAAELLSIEREIDELSEAYGAEEGDPRKLTMREWQIARKVLNARYEAARRALAASTQNGALTAFAGRGGRLRAEWPGMSVDARRAVAAAALDHVVVAPAAKRVGPVFDAARLTLVWRQ